MLNVLVATMLSLHNILQEHSEHTQQANPAIEAEYNNLELRLARTTFRTTWRVKPAFRNNSVTNQPNATESTARDVISNCDTGIVQRHRDHRQPEVTYFSNADGRV